MEERCWFLGYPRNDLTHSSQKPSLLQGKQNCIYSPVQLPFWSPASTHMPVQTQRKAEPEPTAPLFRRLLWHTFNYSNCQVVERTCWNWKHHSTCVMKRFLSCILAKDHQIASVFCSLSRCLSVHIHAKKNPQEIYADIVLFFFILSWNVTRICEKNLLHIWIPELQRMTGKNYLPTRDAGGCFSCLLVGHG